MTLKAELLLKICCTYGENQGSAEQMDKVEKWKLRNFPSTTTEDGYTYYFCLEGKQGQLGEKYWL